MCLWSDGCARQPAALGLRTRSSWFKKWHSSVFASDNVADVWSCLKIFTYTTAQPARQVRALIPSSALLFELQAVEQRVDALLARKKGELQDMQASFRRGAPGSAQASGTVRRRRRRARWCGATRRCRP